MLAEHRRIVRGAFGANGVEIDTQGDAFFFAFPRAREAVAAAVEVQRAHASHAWPDGSVVRVRIGLHTGEPAVHEEGYLGLDVVRAARICTAAQGGHVLLSETTRALLGSALPDGVAVFPRGERHLKGIEEPERVYELEIEGVETEEEAQAPEVSEPAPPAPQAPPAPPAPEAAPKATEQEIERRFDDLGERLAAGHPRAGRGAARARVREDRVAAVRHRPEDTDVEDLAARTASLGEQINARVDAALKARGIDARHGLTGPPGRCGKLRTPPRLDTPACALIISPSSGGHVVAEGFTAPARDAALAEAASPVRDIGDGDGRRVQPGIALCLSGGGYRAMLFHLGALWRLNELGFLGRLDRVSSVSGGSITAGALAHGWARLDFDASGVARDFGTAVVEPLRGLAGRTIDIRAVLLGALLPGHDRRPARRRYRKHLFGDATLQDLPDRPRFVFNATNLQSGVLWRFSKPYMADYRVGTIESPTVKLAVAVAASSAFPPFLSPVTLDARPRRLRAAGRGTTRRAEYTQRGRADRRGRVRQPRPRDGLEALPDRPRQRRRRAVSGRSRT